ncbi:MAG: C40 family peptidase [Bacteroidales bacterium]|nr:C40 family peptidase [Bacteroidales bacterium]
MEKLICANVFVPMRMGPSHRSEQGSQLLFGEKYTQMDRSAGWIKVRNEFDGYEGWLDADHHLCYADQEGKSSEILANRSVFTDKNGNSLILEAGSEIYNYKKAGNSFEIGGNKFTAFSEVTLGPPDEPVGQTAMRFLNCPYLWGGRTGSGLDCSGLTQTVYKIHGYKLPRDSFKQAEAGNTVSFIDEAREGDLLFFDNDQGNITHVGLALGKAYVIHCSGKVRIDRIDHQGIYNETLKKYTHRLRTIKRLMIKD